MLETEIKRGMNMLRILSVEIELVLEDDFLFDNFEVYSDHFEEFCAYKGLTKQSDEYSECEWFGEFVKDYLPLRNKECFDIDNEYIKWLLEKYKGTEEYNEFIGKLCEELETNDIEEVEGELLNYYS
jgi:hypothetical protein